MTNEQPSQMEVLEQTLRKVVVRTTPRERRMRAALALAGRMMSLAEN